jgi:regulatory protein
MGTQDEEALAVAVPADAGASSAAGCPVSAVLKRNIEQDPREEARKIVLRQLAMAPRSRAELLQKLTQRGCDAEVAASVLDRMTQVGLVDDKAYAQMFVRSQQTGRGLAKRALARELRAKGIEAHLADETLASISDAEERDRARALAGKKLRAMHGLGSEVQTRRLVAMLARKGYSSSMVYAVIREVIADTPEQLPG